MKWIVLAVVSLCGVGQKALGESPIQGTWKIQKVECLSGRPYVMFGSGSHITGSYEGTLTVTANQLQLSTVVHAKYDAAAFAKSTQDFNERLAAIKAEPDSVEKTSKLAELNASFAILKAYGAGVICTSKVSAPYEVAGANMHTEVATENTSTCPGVQKDEYEKASDSAIEISENTFKITDSDSEKELDAACPQGDREITTFVRVN